MSSRNLAVSGQFYPDNKNELIRYIEHFNKILEQNNIKKQEDLNIRAIIVPHAGYIYSGFTANFAYKYIPKDIKNIIVIGPSHRYGFEGASVAQYDIYPTPFGELEINKQINENIINKFEFLGFSDTVHKEHSTETQFPFIKYYKSDAKVVELIYSKIEYKKLSLVIEELLKDNNNFIIISTDLSHFYNLDEANKKDKICLDAINKKDIKLIDSGCEACGKLGVKAMLDVANNLNFNVKFLDYRTSGDVTKDNSSVVGYTSFAFYN